MSNPRAGKKHKSKEGNTSNANTKRALKRKDVQVSLPKGDYMVLAEYCRRHRLNYYNTRNHLLSGKLDRPYIHVGRLWLIKH